MKHILALAIAGSMAIHGLCAVAAVSPDEAKQLGTTLTVFGAEKAASADGVIPEYDGGLTKPPAAFDPKTGQWPDPFNSEKPIVSINASNMAQYADQLTPGVQGLLKRFSDYRVDVYPTHRTMHYPQWVLDNTLKNASSAKLVGKVEGDGVDGAFGGIPFPIPKNGYEVMWNNFLNFQRPQYEMNNASAYLMDSSGAKNELPQNDCAEYRPYYDKALAGGKDTSRAYDRMWCVEQAPPTVAGTAVLADYPSNYSDYDQLTWMYMPGQRRTRMAPEYKYDTPISQFGGVEFWDDIQLFRGRMDRFDFKLLGKKQLVIPYNDYRLRLTSVDQLYGAKHVNPDAIRWERHRVWVVEATLKSGVRHAYSKRLFYFDEDTWALVEADDYDQDGKLWKVGFVYPSSYYDGGGGVFTSSYGFYDLQKGNYFLFSTAGSNGLPRLFVWDEHVKPNLFTPAGLAGSGVR
jgi:hypothetical protein